jgi:DNA polymerase-3 subunit gamma/tau
MTGRCGAPVVIDEQAARQTVEQQALQLLQQALGAEKIGEVDHS